LEDGKPLSDEGHFLVDLQTETINQFESDVEEKYEAQYESDNSDDNIINNIMMISADCRQSGVILNQKMQSKNRRVVNHEQVANTFRHPVGGG
jgi:hypothetical protein